MASDPQPSDAAAGPRGHGATARPDGSGDLFRALTVGALRRDVSDRLLGWAWWILDPLSQILIYALVFGSWLGIRRESPHGAYPLFLACAVIPWRWFSQATVAGAAAFRRNGSLLLSAPVNRDKILLAEVAAASIPALTALPIIVVCMVAYDRELSLNMAWLPLPLLLMALLATGIAYLMCPLTVLLPDASNAYTVALRATWFLSPGFYSYAQVPESFQTLYARLNPFVGIFEGIRRPLYEAQPPLWGPLGWSAIWAVTMLVVGRWVFGRLSNRAMRML